MSGPDRDRDGANAIRDFRERKGLSDAALAEFEAWKAAQSPEGKAKAEAAQRAAAEADRFRTFAEASYADASKALTAAEKDALDMIAPEAAKLDPVARMDALKRAKEWAAKHVAPPKPPNVPPIPGQQPSGAGVTPGQDVLDRVQAAYDKAEKSGSPADIEAFSRIQRELAAKGIHVVPESKRGYTHEGPFAFADKVKRAKGQ